MFFNLFVERYNGKTYDMYPVKFFGYTYMACAPGEKPDSLTELQVAFAISQIEGSSKRTPAKFNIVRFTN